MLMRPGARPAGGAPRPVRVRGPAGDVLSVLKFPFVCSQYMCNGNNLRKMGTRGIAKMPVAVPSIISIEKKNKGRLCALSR